MRIEALAAVVNRLEELLEDLPEAEWARVRVGNVDVTVTKDKNVVVNPQKAGF